MKKLFAIVTFGVALLLGGCSKELTSTTSVHTEPVKLSEYLCEITYTKLLVSDKTFFKGKK